jgi:hypothetical protein
LAASARKPSRRTIASPNSPRDVRCRQQRPVDEAAAAHQVRVTIGESRDRPCCALADQPNVFLRPGFALIVRVGLAGIERGPEQRRTTALCDPERPGPAGRPEPEQGKFWLRKQFQQVGAGA